MLSSIILLTTETFTKKLEISQVGWVDIVFVLVVLWAFIEGYRAGFVKEFSKFISVIMGLFITFNYFEPLTIWTKRNSFIPQDVAGPLIYITVLIVSIIVIFYILQFFGKLFEVKVFQLFEKVGGMLLAIGRYCLILGLITHFLFFFPIPFIENSFKNKSISGPYLITVCPKTYSGMSKLLPLPKWQLEPQVTMK
ncbi:MAG: CvpA family protein [Candidatus Omnitrophica bacterium]|nr:CvpA family protein [Candidatus Omnitrophota bacterium]